MIRTLTTKEAIEANIKVMEGYLQMKVCERDWHGVSDAANDLRVLECKLESIKDHIKIREMFDMNMGGSSVDCASGTTIISTHI